MYAFFQKMHHLSLGFFFLFFFFCEIDRDLVYVVSHWVIFWTQFLIIRHLNITKEKEPEKRSEVLIRHHIWQFLIIRHFLWLLDDLMLIYLSCIVVWLELFYDLMISYLLFWPFSIFLNSVIGHEILFRLDFWMN